MFRFPGFILLFPLAFSAACGVEFSAASGVEFSAASGVDAPATGEASSRVVADTEKEDSLDALIAARMAEAHLPGLSTCVVKHGAVVWCRAHGLADLDTGRPVTTDTVFLIASLSKTITATALMQGWEAGAMELDDDVDEAVGFQVKHPGFADPITYRMLLTHTASIRDDGPTLDALYALGSDPTVSLGAATAGYFDPKGVYYDATKNFVPARPGTVVEYANMGFALAGELVQSLTKTDFAVLTRATILSPLGLARASWRLSDFDVNELAVPYGWDGSQYVSYGQYTFADYPDGGLRATAPEMARFLAMLSAGGALDGHRILRADTVASMFAVQHPEIDGQQGLCFSHVEIGGEDWIGDIGAESGVAAEMDFRPSDGLGFVLLMNGGWGENAASIHAIRDAIIDFGNELGNNSGEGPAAGADHG